MSLDPALLDAFDDAQRRAITVLSSVIAELHVGLSELDVARLCDEKARHEGFDGCFHPPEVMVGKRSAVQRIWASPSATARIEPGSPVIIDIAPASDRVFGNIGATVVLPEGQRPEVVDVALECTRGCLGFSNHMKTVGELFVFARAWAINHRLELASKRSIGHAMLPPEGLLATNYPRSAHLATWLRRHQVHFLNPARMQGLWAFRPQLSDGHVGAAFREVIVVDGEDKRLLGRDSMDEVGTFSLP